MRTEFVTRAATFLAMVVAGYFLGTYLDLRFSSDEAFYRMASSEHAETTAPTPPVAACVRKDGSWKNWPWPNVPMLSPKCAKDDG